MVKVNSARCAFTVLGERGLEENLVGVLSVKHVVNIAPLLLVVVEVVLVQDFTSLPVAHDEFHLSKSKVSPARY